ncbi:Macrophage migration inhibitory factor (MIF) [Lachnospiraceae bacterium NE2001]|nr:Macrophage migration inhibitory factor (MIF) [Lachnospiraceae bacterium NE2001]SEQ98907.1 Macrophage migration inhibitory factor (MIF) [Lachnospiraceae bacterium NE2001]
MPFVDSKITLKISDEKKEALKAKIGEAISIIGKPESYLMVGFEDDYTLYFAGNKLEKGAYVSIDVFGSVNSSQADQMTARICEIYEEELGIPGNNIYVEYRGTRDWGWNGRNF